MKVDLKDLHRNVHMLLKNIKIVFDKITSTRFAGLYLLLFALAIGVATFIENDFGTSAAQELIFRSTWFEILLALFGLTILANMWRFKLVKQKKWTSLCFHLAIIVILLGAAVTRYWGTEGMMHIREGETTNHYLSAESFLKFQVNIAGKSYSFDEPVHFSSLSSNSFDKEYQIGNRIISIHLDQFLPNPTQKLVEDPRANAILKVVIGGGNGREEYFVSQGEKAIINGINFNFSEDLDSEAFNISKLGDSLFFQTSADVNQRVMITQQVSDLPGGTPHPLKLRSLYTLNGASFVVGDYLPHARVSQEMGSKKITNESIVGLNLSIASNGHSEKILVSGRKGEEGNWQEVSLGDMQMAISYGSRIETLPFSLLCKDFILEKYPGTENASSYASEVTLFDKENSVNNNFRIYMNNILEYQGYRFFQSSFDQDELGTYLSVNHDFWGTWISYIGYIMLTLGLCMTFFDKKSRFTFLLTKLKSFQLITLLVGLFLFQLPWNSFAEINTGISKEHAIEFGKLVVQDHNGRVKPLNTYTGELLRKIARTETLFDQSSDQIILGMMLNPAAWEKENIIKLPDNPEIKRLLHTEASMVSYASFFSPDGNYLLEKEVRGAQAMIPKEQGVLEKALVKLDEKVNIVNMIFSGSIMKLFPKPSDSTNTWLSPAELMHEHTSDAFSLEMRTLFLNYINAVSEGVNSNDFEHANLTLAQISAIQKFNGASIMPSESQLKAELFLNQLDVFSRLRNYYGILCLLMTGGFLMSTIQSKSKRATWTKIAFYAMALGFFFHTLGLGLRWYVSERAPWSNGYESMIYIGWTTMLAGTLFSRKSLGGLAATATLAATVLLVASMSWLDPEITPLVPVLKSYWLTIHVSLEAGSYGFLMLGAVLGMLNLTLMIFMNQKNKNNVYRAIQELTVISEITLLGGLAMISIGTYLGGVWANESWGRYWGWDAKETWALVTILVYSFILHMRFIPKLQGIFAFNFASLFGFATVIMTYLGVNYYLSGLHSYAAGDPVPVPPQVYFTSIFLVLLSILAFRNFKKQHV